jgi:hypothetical protein
MAGGARPGSGAKKGSHHRRVTAREGKLIRAAEKLAAEIAARRPPPGQQLGKDILSMFANQCTSIAARLAPAPGEDGRLRWPFPGAEKQYFRWIAEVRAFAVAVAPFESPTFRSVAIAPAPGHPDDDTKVVELNIFDHRGERLLPLPDPPPSAAPANMTPWAPRPVAEPDDD